jgi:2'-5' RNA ligase
MRLFVAVNIPENLKKSISKLVERVRVDNDFIRWIPPGNVHITLKFLGEVAPSLLAEIEEVLESTTSRYPSFHLTVEGAGAFPHMRKPRVVWLGIRGGEILHSIHSDLNRDLARLGFEMESRPFRPHLTIGRARSSRSGKGMRLESIEDRFVDVRVEVVRFQVTSVELMESFLEPTGAVYRERISAPLRE